MQKIAVCLVIALVSALVMSALSGGVSYEERLVRASLQDTLGPYAREVFAEPADCRHCSLTTPTAPNSS